MRMDINMIKEFMTEYGYHLIAITLTGIISYMGICLKNILIHKEKITSAEIVYHGVKELYPNINSNDQKEKMLTNLKQILQEKNIKATNLEIKLLIYSRIHKEKSLQ